MLQRTIEVGPTYWIARLRRLGEVLNAFKPIILKTFLIENRFS
jgi:hypothetical protein